MPETEYSVLCKKMIDYTKNIKQITITILIGLTCLLGLTGCGKDPALETYKANMETYFESAATLDSRMNSVAQSSFSTEDEYKQACSSMLKYLDQLETITIQMSELEVPKQFELNETLADEAASNMTSAVELYHQYYEFIDDNPGVLDAATEYYVRANKRIFYIKSILHGEIPNELHVEYEEESD